MSSSVRKFFFHRYSTSVNQFRKLLGKGFYISLIFSLFSGVILTLGFAPINNPIAVLISIVLFLYLIKFNIKATKIKIFLIGWCFAIGHFVSSLYWIANSLTIDLKTFWWLIPFTVIGIPSIIGIFFGIMSIIIVYIMIKLGLATKVKFYIPSFNNAFLFSLNLSLLWLLVEFCRSYIILPFPWNLLGYATGYSLELMQLANIFTVYGLSFFLIFISASIFTCNVRMISLSAVLIMCALFYGHYRLYYLNDKTNSINMISSEENGSGKINDNLEYGEDRLHLIIRGVQPGSSIAFTDAEKMLALLNTVNISDIKAGIDYVIWPESALQFNLNLNEKNEYDEWFIEFAESFLGQNVGMISGVNLYKKAENKIFNAIVVYDDESINDDIDRVFIQTYSKRILVPFGEYIPWRFVFNNLPAVVSFGDIDFSFGDSDQSNLKLRVKNNKSKKNQKDGEDFIFQAAPYICYEIIFPYPFAKDNLKSADFLLNITNDIWFGNTIGPDQHMAMARMRAIEANKPLVRVANTGISALIDAKGRIIFDVKLNQEAVFDFMISKN